MRHLKSGSKLGRNPWHRRATLRNLVTNLLEHGRITTTLTRAKAARPVAEKIITLGKRDTLQYPEEAVYLPPRYRGRIVLTRDPDGEERCVACNLCAVACPVGCISLQKAETEDGRWYPDFFRINFSRCIFCGLCEEACPTTAIQLTPDFEMAEFKRQDLV